MLLLLCGAVDAAVLGVALSRLRLTRYVLLLKQDETLESKEEKEGKKDEDGGVEFTLLDFNQPFPLKSIFKPV